ncbi:hypothetical protein FJJ79_05410 [Escherichia coli]|nr:hypothetical protein [Escherichia coli]EAA5674218.1 hypothetical protein [Escherichia coli]EEW5316226.1 hypothetical protein [Escherichia coli]EEY7916902.1 hypothetical protein [Escherichia coli]EEZ0168315.1 hypothetical protein [Escherichia coli]
MPVVVSFVKKPALAGFFMPAEVTVNRLYIFSMNTFYHKYNLCFFIVNDKIFHLTVKRELCNK